MIVMAASIAKVLTGAGIGIGVACKLGEEDISMCISRKCRNDRSICNRAARWKCDHKWQDHFKRARRTIRSSLLLHILELNLDVVL